MGGPYGAASDIGSVMADRTAAHERLTHLVVAEVADIGQRHAAIRLLQTAACRRHQHLAMALDSEASYPLLAQADTLNEVALLFALDIDANVPDPVAKKDLE